MTTLHVGATLETLPGPKYMSSLAFAEYAPAPPAPRPGKLRRFRRDSPGALLLALVAPPSMLAPAGDALRMDDALRAGIEWLTEASDALQACAIVLPTGPELTTGRRHRDRLAAYVDRLPRREGCRLVWNPAGLWEADDARRFAATLGVVAACDPLQDELAPAPLIYARVRAMGARSRISDGMLQEVRSRVTATGAADAFVSLASARSFQEARRLQRICSDGSLEP